VANKRFSFNLRDLHKAYQAGEPIKSIANRIGYKGESTIWRLFKSAGFKVRTRSEAYADRRRFPESEVPKMYSAYLTGESAQSIGRRYGTSHWTILKAFVRAGLRKRTQAESNFIRSSRMTPEQHRSNATAANAACRGRKASFAERSRTALTHEAFPKAPSALELRVLKVLKMLNLPITREKACGIYNIDFAVGHSIAVECFGGGWHAGGRAAARHQPRVRYLIDTGFHVVIVWVDKRHDGWINALKNIIANFQKTGGNPASPRQYRVIWSDGYVGCSRNSKDNDFPLKPTFRVSRNAEGRYYSIAS
jgi:very-short-patch-repair endonuclease